jgi:exosortase
MTASATVERPGFAPGLPGSWPLWLGLAVLAVPTMARLADQSWSHEFGAYGPIILATGGWLLWRQLGALRSQGVPGAPSTTWVALGVALGSYVFGRAYDFLPLEVGGVYLAGLAMLQSRFGLGAMRSVWFPLLYLAFVIPPPGTLLVQLTAPLKQEVSHVATDWLHSWGLPVAREGVTIFVAQYQLLVEDACSGMNSIVGLIAVSLLYIYLMRGSSLVYSIILVIVVIPVAIVANILRIMVLVLLTYFYGNEVAQGFLHFTAGMFLFATALLFVFLIDHLLVFVGSKLRRTPA